jgi:hypothetical protein
VVRFVVQVISVPLTVPSDLTSLPSRSFDVTTSFSPVWARVISETRSPRGVLEVIFHLPLTPASSAAASGRAAASTNARPTNIETVLRVMCAPW